MVNMFLEAINKNDLDSFLLGTDEYFIGGNEWSGGNKKHDSGSSFSYIKNSIIKNEITENEVYKLLEKSIIRLFNRASTANLLLETLMLIWRCYTAYECASFRVKWKVSDDLLLLIKENYHYWIEMQKSKDDQVVELLEVRRKLLKERFDFEF